MKRYQNICKLILIFIILQCAVKLCNCARSPQYRLLNTTKPIHYDIKIQTEIDQNDFQFNGEIEILLNVEIATNIIELHTKNATINNIELKEKGGGNVIKIENHLLNNITDILTITTETELKKDIKYILKIEYDSELRSDNLGFYKSSYMDKERGRKVWLAATQFAPTEARHAFPCYDEPRFKTTFKIELIHSKNLFALSNTEMETKTHFSENLYKTTFKTTPIMPTYLIAFIISDFYEIKSKSLTDEKISHSTYVRKNRNLLAKYAANYGIEVYTALYKILNGNKLQPNEISEIKQIMLSDFHFSGMENWGAITYQEQKLFYDEKIHSSKDLYGILYLMGHEMAHQWFGNLMTHEWWTYVWLKEGFSTLYGYYGADSVKPKWNLMELYQTDVLHYVFGIDDDLKIRPMSFYVEKQPDIKKNYDRIAYEKSSCVLRMFDNALEQKIFKEGVNIFLEDRKFNSATEDDLFISLDTALRKNNKKDINIIETFRNWTHQGGYPLLTIEVRNKVINLHQQRFLKSESFGINSASDSIWHIPINYEIPNPIGSNFKNTSVNFWMKSSKLKKSINNVEFDSTKHWIIANIQQTGYYRVNYNKENWNLIIETLKKNHKEIHVANRAQLLDDAFTLANVGLLDYEILFNLIKYLENEEDYAPWRAFQKNMNLLKQRLTNSENKKLIKKTWDFIDQLVKVPFQKFGLFKLSSDLPSVSLTRSIIAEYACNANNNKCKNNTSHYNSTDMRKIYYCEKLKNNGNDTIAFLELKNLIRSSEDIKPQRLEYISVLGCTTNENILNSLLFYTIQTEDSDLQLDDKERSALLQSIFLKSRIGLKLSIDFIKKMWRKLNTALCDKCLGTAISSMSNLIQNQDDIKKFNELLGIVEIDSENSNKAAQNIINNVQWDALYIKKIENLLNSSGILSFINLKLLILLSVFINYL